MPDLEQLTRTVLTDAELEKVVEHVSSKVLAHITEILVATLIERLETELVPRVEKRIQNNFIMAVGQTVVNKTLWIIGAIVLFLFFWLARVGVIKIGPLGGE